ncbi:MAG TPA: hypothetical protein PKA63_04345 [Oligoflexia bacterium]|nr:hypothetical protein [Oligoflexia bacterium]HMP47880.1 hypothetical protein [Oligoflexia bacterium]
MNNKGSSVRLQLRAPLRGRYRGVLPRITLLTVSDSKLPRNLNVSVGQDYPKRPGRVYSGIPSCKVKNIGFLNNGGILKEDFFRAEKQEEKENLKGYLFKGETFGDPNLWIVEDELVSLHGTLNHHT